MDTLNRNTINGNTINRNTFFVYDIINNTAPQVIFYYCCILIIIILLLNTGINLSLTLFIGLIGYSILIYYLWYSRNTNVVNNKDKFNTKLETTHTINSIPDPKSINSIPDPKSINGIPYPKSINDSTASETMQLIGEKEDIVDFLYYMRDLKGINFSLYDEINVSFTNIVFLYNSIKIDKSLVFDYYNTINTLKLKILDKIESYNLITTSNTYNDKIKNLRLMAENIINRMLTELYEISKKNIYYNNYKNSTKIITKNKVLEYNIFDSNNENIRNTVPFSVSSTYML
jgi:hypothetical protein